MNTACKIKPKGTRAKSGALHLTQKVDYAFFLLTVLSQSEDGEIPSIATIARDHHLSFSFLQKIANHLKRAGFVRSHRGKDGGYSLHLKTTDIRLKDVIESLEGPIVVASCIEEGSHDCPRKSFCSIRAGFKRINDEILELHLSKTLADFLS